MKRLIVHCIIDADVYDNESADGVLEELIEDLNNLDFGINILGVSEETIEDMDD